MRCPLMPMSGRGGCLGSKPRPRPDLRHHLVRRVLPSARCTVYDQVSAGWSELCSWDGHHAANRLPATEASMSRPEEVCTVTPVTSLPTYPSDKVNHPSSVLPSVLVVSSMRSEAMVGGGALSGS